ncbi:MAG: hypothetical protein K0R44_2964 [Thermomicrobiales bacterium]|nr:hypothetical protein [Thermomicrobiales bacterium]
MLVERTVFQAKYGRGDELVALFQELNGRLRDEMSGEQARRFRILTDASGHFFTVVTELEVENFATWERISGEAMKLPWMGEWFSRMIPLVEFGSREFYTIVEDSPR